MRAANWMGTAPPRLLIISAEPGIASDLIEACLGEGLVTKEASQDGEHVRTAAMYHPDVLVFVCGSDAKPVLQLADELFKVPSLENIPKLGFCKGRKAEATLWAAGCNLVFPVNHAAQMTRQIKGLARLNQTEKVNAQQIELEIALASLETAYDATIEGWVMALDLRDQETEKHSLRVASMTAALALQMGFSNEQVKHIYRGALLHDIGKLGMPDSILLKTDRLTPEERTEMQRHPEHAYNMLAGVTYLAEAIAIPYSHHERWDGAGYPLGLKGEDIPLSARMFSVIDVYDALRFDRPYRKGWEDSKVREYLRSEAGTAFDPDVVEAFIIMLECLGPEAMSA